ncbi:MAG: NAD(P)H-hydrate dehydratase [Gemmataceae bacterium]|nr:NAD(P)H-hydrate dehydratase [Gemmataceae bacterium]
MEPASPVIVTEVPTLPPRRLDSHKGDFGRVLVLAGSRGMAGAAVLCGTAALRGGSGLVRVAVPQEILPTVAAGNPCYMTAPLPQDAQGRLAVEAEAELLELARAHDVLAIGPGLGRSPGITALLAALLAQAPGPIVLDADGLKAFAGQSQGLKRTGAALVLTPHPGELARLLGVDAATVQARRRELAVRFAAEHDSVVLLKGHGTLVTDGRLVYQNTTGNPGMATGGSGDVLTGLIAALLGQGQEAFAAAQLGAYLHGLAGDLARVEVGEASLIAGDLLHYLPAAFLRHHGR